MQGASGKGRPDLVCLRLHELSLTEVALRLASIRQVILDTYDANEVLSEGFDSP